jgi:hypothetical protein
LWESLAHQLLAMCDKSKYSVYVPRVLIIVDLNDIHSHFGSAFQDAVRRTKAHVKHDSFETSVMEIRQDDLENFIENLHLGA